MTKIIMQHANNRLYDTGQRRNINLSELVSMVSTDEAFEVVDRATGEYITAAVLTRILHCEVLRSRSFDTVPNLRRTIKTLKF